MRRPTRGRASACTARLVALAAGFAAVIVAGPGDEAWCWHRSAPGEDLPLTSFFSLVLAFNPGAAFSFLAGADGWQRWLFAVIAVAACGVMVWLLRRGGRALFCAGLALIIGGALGNLYDRLTLGHVVDFLLLHYRGWYYPAFNVADSAITVGAAAADHRQLPRAAAQTDRPEPAGDR